MAKGHHLVTNLLLDQATTQVAIPDSKGGQKKNPEGSGLSERCKNLGQTMFSKKQLYKKVPILEWLPKYNLEKGVADLIAGVTVGLTVIPQGIAYALVAKLPPQYGLYSAFMGCFMYMIFGSCKDITVGPTAIMALLTSEYASKDPAFVILLTFLSGLIIMTLGFLRLGFVIDFISVPVTAGFTSAAAITIASGQVKSIFGLNITHHSHVEGFIGDWMDVFDNFTTARLSDSLLGLICIMILLLLRTMKNVKWFDESQPESNPTGGSEGVRKALKTTIWVLSTARNAIVVILCTVMAYGFDPVIPSDARDATFILTGDIQRGLPPFQPPPFSFNDTSSTASGDIIDFKGMISELGSAIAIIPLLAILENVAIAKAFSGGKPIDASQEMIALGICNVMGSFVSSMPTTGSFSRTAVNSASGVRTTFGGIFTGSLVILALAVLMPYCAYIPKASLAAVIITAVIFSVEYEVIRPMWKSKKIDLIPAFATFACCLFWALEYGILVGVGIQVMIILYQTARPSIHVDLRVLNGSGDHVGGEFLYITLDRALVFPSVSYVRHQINKSAISTGQSQLPVVLDCSHISSADFTAAEGFKAMVEDFHSRSQNIIFYNTAPSVVDTFEGVEMPGLVVVQSFEELFDHLKALMERPPSEASDNLNTTEPYDDQTIP